MALKQNDYKFNFRKKSNKILFYFSKKIIIYLKKSYKIQKIYIKQIKQNRKMKYKYKYWHINKNEVKFY